MNVDKVSITMSPQHFKGFCRSLNETLKAYENVFGVLQIPDVDTGPLRSAAQIETLITEARNKAKELTAMPSSSTEKKQPSKRSRSAARK
jgi:hypothetical protein